MLNQQKMEGMNSEQAQLFAFSSSRPTFSNISENIIINWICQNISKKYRKCHDFLIPIYRKGGKLNDISDIFDMSSICATLVKI